MINLFCFPYAGGSSSLFKTWANKLSKEINVIPVEYPGHGFRFNEPLQSDIHSLVDILFKELKQKIIESEYCLFGHSLGALVAYELTLKIRRASLNLPLNLIVSGAGGAQFREKDRIAHLPRQVFIHEMQKKYHGFIEIVLKNHELLELIVPVLQADFSIAENYYYQPQTPLDCPIRVIRAVNDSSLILDELLGWQEHSKQKISIIPIPGDHFSLFRKNNDTAILLSHLDALCKVKRNTSF